MLLIFKQNLFIQDTRLLKKNKEKNITKVKLIDLPDKLKEKKNNKAKYIAQKSYVSKKNVKKNTPLLKQKPRQKHRKTAVVKESIPLIPSNKTNKKISEKKINGKKVKVKNKSRLSKKFKQQKLVKHTKKNKTKKSVSIVKKELLKSKKHLTSNKKHIKKNMLTLNKISPTYRDLIAKGLVKDKPVKNDNKARTDSKYRKLPREYKSIDVPRLSSNIFQSSHIYPDDIDTSDSISISTQSSRFASYLHKVKRKIELVWEYPRIAGEMGIQGRLFVKLQIDKSGRLIGVTLLKSSGASILDREAIRAIKEAAPYPPFPKDNGFGVNSIKIHACFEYVIGGKELW